MMKKIRMILLLLCVGLLACMLCACDTPSAGAGDGTDDEGTAVGEPDILHCIVTDLTDHMPLFLTEMYQADEAHGGISSSNSYMIGSTLYVYSPKNDAGEAQPRIIPFTGDGVRADEQCIAVPTVDGIVPVYAQKLQWGGFCLLYERPRPEGESSVTETKPVAAITDPMGQVLAAVMFQGDYEYPSASGRVAAYNYVISDEDNGDVSMAFSYNGKIDYYRYTPDGNTITKKYSEGSSADKIGGLDHASYLGDRKYLLKNQGQFSVVLDMHDGTTAPIETLYPDIGRTMYTEYGTDGTLYTYDSLALYRYNEDGFPTRVINFLECGITPSYHDTWMWIADDASMYLAMDEERGGETVHVLYHIRVGDALSSAARTRLQIDYYGRSNGETYPWVLHAVRSFNAENTQYFADLCFYDLAVQDITTVKNKIDERLLYEAHPDLLMTEVNAITAFYDKGAFLDLNDTLEATLLGCVRASGLHGGALYAVPLDASILTLVCNKSVTDSLLTWEKFFAIIDGMEAEDVLSSEPYIDKRIYENGIMDFFDQNTHTAMYDTALFCDMIEYTAGLEALVDESVGKLGGADKMEAQWDYGYTNATLPDRLAEGKLKLLGVRLTDIRRLVEMKMLFGDTLNWCGYPSRNGGGATITANATVSLMADSAHAEGGVAFISHLLSDEVQTHHTHENFPVTQSAVRTQLAATRYHYYEQGKYDAIGDPNQQVSGLGGFSLSGGKVLASEPVISLQPDLSAAESVDPAVVLGDTEKTYVEVYITDAEIDTFMTFLNSCYMRRGIDNTVLEIVEEELSFWEGGVTGIEEAAKKIQSRVQIYLDEST